MRNVYQLYQFSRLRINSALRQNVGSDMISASHIVARPLPDETLAPLLHIELVSSPIAIHSFRDRIADPDVGAHAWFEGVTRRMTGGRETVRLSYEAFEPMAIAELRRLGQVAAQQFRLTALVLVHRLGVVPIGEASLIVGCSSPHRAAVFSALPTIVNALKTDVPIWKQEHYADGTAHWVHPT